MSDSTRRLADFCANLAFKDIPEPVVARCEDLFLDWLGSALAGSQQHPTAMFERHAQQMGPADGPSEIISNCAATSPYFAAFVNAASSHVVEQDDLHNSSVLHPATVVFPAALAAAQDKGVSGRELIAASVAGYEAGVRVGEFLGRSHYRVFHTTGTAGTLAAAVAAARVLGVDTDTTIHTLGSAGTQAAGLWAFLRDGADSKQLHTAKAAGNGLLSAYMSADGLTGAQSIFDSPQGMAAGMSSDADASRLDAQLGTRWALAETSFKFHASCRHTHPAADALLSAMTEYDLKADDIATVTARVHEGAIDVLGAVNVPRTIHQAKFSMGTVLGLIAVHGAAGLTEFDQLALTDKAVAAFRDKVTMALDNEVDAAYPARWLGRVDIETTDGRRLHGASDEPKGDPGNTLSRAELEAKFVRLVQFADAAGEAETRALIDTVWALREHERVPQLRAEKHPEQRAAFRVVGMNNPAARPLDGITVVSFEHAIAAPFCTRQLADLGARVIKIERPGVGDFARGYDQRVRGLSSHFVWTNRSKESLTLNIKHADATAILDQLLAEADVLVQNLAPGAAARLGLSFDDLHARFPQLIVCNISGYGETGPYTDKKAYDLLIQSESGLLSVTGGPEAEQMAKAGCSIADIAAGMVAQNAIMAALIQRGKTGEGTTIDVSMLEALIEWMGYPMYYAFEGQTPPPRAGAAHSTIYPYGPFVAGDDRSVMLGLQNEREWGAFCDQVLQQPELARDTRFASNSGRSANRGALRAIIHEAFAELSSEQVIERLGTAGIANAHVNDMAGVWAHPQLAARDRWRTIGSPEGELPALLPPAINRAFEPRMDAVPALGEHTDAILSELDYDAAAIEGLRADGAV